MLDAFYVSPVVHLTVGTLVLVAGALALIALGLSAWRKQPPTRGVQALFILFQLSLMLQALVGVKLLDQGAGPLQLVIHYVGGLAPLAFVLAFYWFTGSDSLTRTRRAFATVALAFVFVLLTFAVGSMAGAA